MSKPFFSVLIPCYNVERYVEECVSSVINQSFEDWEMVLVDDGSTDLTGKILDAFHEELPEKIRVIHQTNAGLLVSRRTSLKYACGNYVVFLDSDDALRSDALELIHEQLIQYPGSLVQYRLSRDGDYSSVYAPLYEPELHLGSAIDIRDYRQLICSGSSYNNLCGKAIPAECLDADADYSMYSSVKNAEDLLQLVAVLDKVEKVVMMGDVLYFYRPNSSSITHTFQPDFYRSVKAAVSVLRDRAGEWGDPELDSLLKTKWICSCLNAISLLQFSDYDFARLVKSIETICDDGYFKTALAEVDMGGLSKKKALIARLVKKGWVHVVAMLICVQRMRKVEP